MNPKPGEIWLADLRLAAKLRPVLIVSREDPDPPRVLFIYVPRTTQNRGSRYEVALGRVPFLSEESHQVSRGAIRGCALAREWRGRRSPGSRGFRFGRIPYPRRFGHGGRGRWRRDIRVAR